MQLQFFHNLIAIQRPIPNSQFPIPNICNCNSQKKQCNSFAILKNCNSFPIPINLFGSLLLGLKHAILRKVVRISAICVKIALFRTLPGPMLKKNVVVVALKNTLKKCKKCKCKSSVKSK